MKKALIAAVAALSAAAWTASPALAQHWRHDGDNGGQQQDGDNHGRGRGGDNSDNSDNRGDGGDRGDRGDRGQEDQWRGRGDGDRHGGAQQQADAIRERLFGRRDGGNEGDHHQQGGGGQWNGNNGQWNGNNGQWNGNNGQWNGNNDPGRNWGHNDHDGRDRGGRNDHDGRDRDWGRNDHDGRDRDWANNNNHWRDGDWRDDHRRDDHRYDRYRSWHRDFDRPRYRDWRQVRYGSYFDFGYSRIVGSYFHRSYYWWSYDGWRRPYRRWAVGYPFPSYLYWEPVPYDLYYELPPAPYGCRYVMYDDDILLIVISTGVILDALMYYD